MVSECRIARAGLWRLCMCKDIDQSTDPAAEMETFQIQFFT